MNDDDAVLTLIGRTYSFESAHRLPNLPDGHKCKNLHGHNYRMEVVMRGGVDARGFVKDFAEMDAELEPLLKLVDHRLLNWKTQPPRSSPVGSLIAFPIARVCGFMRPPIVGRRLRPMAAVQKARRVSRGR
ncbi:6-pyruvoyl tetrahydropterin synthase/QueD family protein [Bradyrhizobium sp. USDA 4532]|nr:6-pyruvoyl tetrahydropterin synthase/QueD family protein [Bradyrhizobium sp. USDA 4545]MCP1919916.1 6-pyruvoyl tetrahydropterin synthase/QueD family protein [Bradyrhizobium sp. USDA 4532]